MTGTLGANIEGIDMSNGSTLNFTDGASFASNSTILELRQNPNIGFVLSETGSTIGRDAV